jgi:hypothetical protein
VTGDVDDAKARLAGQIIDLPGVTAIGVGESGGSPCIRVWVVELTEELREAIPRSFEDFPVLVQESGPIRALDEDM